MLLLLYVSDINNVLDTLVATRNFYFSQKKLCSETSSLPINLSKLAGQIILVKRTNPSKIQIEPWKYFKLDERFPNR